MLSPGPSTPGEAPASLCKTSLDPDRLHYSVPITAELTPASPGLTGQQQKEPPKAEHRGEGPLLAQPGTLPTPCAGQCPVRLRSSCSEASGQRCCQRGSQPPPGSRLAGLTVTAGPFSKPSAVLAGHWVPDVALDTKGRLDRSLPSHSHRLQGQVGGFRTASV